MKLKIYVIKKQQIIWTAAILTILIIAAILVITLKTTQTIDFFNLSHSYKADINNDGKVDSIVGKIDDVTQKYSISIVCSDGNGYNLEPDPYIKSFGYSKSTYPINITFNDINADGKQEIFIQSSDKDGPILHVFKYTNNNIERIVSGRYSLYGVIKDPKDSAQMLVLYSYYKNNTHLSYLKADSGNLVPYSAPESLSLGKNALYSLVKAIENKDVETFTSNIDSKLEAKLVKGNLIDGIMENVTYSNYDIPSECTYVLRTDCNNGSKTEFITYKVKMSLKNYDSRNPEYIVSNIEEIK